MFQESIEKGAVNTEEDHKAYLEMVADYDRK